jgi:O-antigen/teichoic acid export membrane protein
MPNRERLLDPTFRTGSVSVMVLALGAISGILIARALGASGRGELVAAQAAPMILGMLGSLGMSESVAYCLAHSREPAQSEDLSSAVPTALAIVLAASTLLAIAGAIVYPLFISDQPADVVAASRIMMLYGVGLGPVLVAQGYYRGRGQIDKWNAMRLLPALAWTTSSIVVVLFGATVFRVSVGLVAASFASSSLALISIASLVRAGRPSRIRASELLRFGVPAAASSFPRSLNASVDQVLLIPYTSSAQLGVYALAVTWSGIISPIGSAGAMSRFPEVAARSGIDQWRFVRSILLRAVMVSSVIGLLLAAITPWAIPVIFGTSYESGIGVTAAMVVAGIMLAIKDSTTQCLWASGRPGLLLVSDVVALAFTLSILLVLVPHIGVWAAVIASVVAYSVSSFGGVAMLRSAYR